MRPGFASVVVTPPSCSVKSRRESSHGSESSTDRFRPGYIRSHDSRWFAGRNYAEWLHEDIKIRNFIKKELDSAMVSRVEIERLRETMTISIHAGRPGTVIGKGGAGIERLEKRLFSPRRKTASA